ncbi:type II secretion system protein [Pseudomonas lopnurensis]|uniref:type II secretion system protein n=1 Tax=Pseudomonas lopnurensis TaxID=1477517 RepID=UPI0018794560|nr:type II secretion system protein [Pseudomonas lopnurensis]MBE7374783.1 type II secretion system protein [Pseudomonas lopnurensis]
MNREKGFTLFELTVVIAVFSVLLASGLYYFQTTIQNSYRLALKFTASSLSRAVLMAHEQRQLPQYLDSPDTAGAQMRLVFNAQGWPVGVAGKAALESADDCIGLWRALLHSPVPTIGLDDSKDWRAEITSAQCIYKSNRTAGLIYFNSQTGEVDYKFSDG